MDEYIKNQVGRKPDDADFTTEAKKISSPEADQNQEEEKELGSEGLQIEDVTITNAEAKKKAQKSE